MCDMAKPALVLLVICFVVGAAMALTNALTEDRIAQRIKETAENSRRAVLPGADGFQKLDIEKIKALGGGEADTIEEAYAAKKNGRAEGYVFLAGPKGYGGEISMTVGINARGEVAGLEIGDNKETPGLGSKAADREFRDQYLDRRFGVIRTVKGKAQKDDEVQAVSGATITSAAVSRGVEQASMLAHALLSNNAGVSEDELVENTR